MKQIILLLVVVSSLSVFCTARADNPDKCFWYMNGSAQHQDALVNIPPNTKLKLVGVGQVMASVDMPITAPTIVWANARCPLTIPKITQTTGIEPGSIGPLEPGYTDVYRTGLAGVGLRLKMGQRVVPFTLSAKNGNSVSSGFINSNITYEFIRTAQRIELGEFIFDYKISYRLNNWHAATIHGSGSSLVETDSYFAGCAGVKKDIKVLMSKIWTGELESNSARTEAFDLDVRCTGQPAGTKLPVKVYFEGDSPGDGRLNLNTGGATGVEISLQNAVGAALPFSQDKALSMEWMRSDAEGEIYNLAIRARYKQKPGSSVTVGRADAVLNYIIEYN